MKVSVVIVGGGASGFSAAVVAKRLGAEVTLIERTDTLGGLALVAGMGMSHSALVVLTEEKAMGGADLLDVLETIAVHRGINIPGVSDNVMTYSVTRLDAAMQKALKAVGVDFILRRTVTDVTMTSDRIEAVVLQDGTTIRGDAFVDATGGVEGLKACTKWGRGCVECILRCPSFGSPRGIAEKRAKKVARLNGLGKPGVFGVSVMIPIVSLSPELQKEVTQKGYAVIPVPPNAVVDEERMKMAGAPESFRHDIHKQNIFLVDLGGYVKITALGAPMFAGSLRSFPGMEEAFITEPGAGAIGHLVMGTAGTLRENSLKVPGFDNLFCCGAKSGPVSGLRTAMMTGDLAGYNAVRMGLGQSCLELPTTLMSGAFLDLVDKRMRTREGLKRGYSYGEPEILISLGVYRTDIAEIIKMVKKVGLRDIYRKRLVKTR